MNKKIKFFKNELLNMIKLTQFIKNSMAVLGHHTCVFFVKH